MPYPKTEEGRKQRKKQYTKRIARFKELGLNSKGLPYETDEQKKERHAVQSEKLKQWLDTEAGKAHLENIAKINRKHVSDEAREVYTKARKVELRKTSLKHNLSDKLKYAKYRAKRDKLPLDIDVDYLLSIYTGVCPYLNIPLTLDSVSGNSLNAISLDKIIPELGYVKGNVQLISYKANVMKQDVSLELLRTFARSVLENHGDI